MTRRLDKTLGDYVAIAISPVLIMTLVGSLLFFLVEVFYQGHYAGRLHWVLALFTMAAVLIGRIAIEEGKERAQMFAAPLGIVTYLALFRFVQFHGGLLGSVSWAANLFLLGLVWWSAHKLTWDCTLIDESEDASGEGLMQTIGLDDSPANTGPPVSEAPKAKEEEPEGVTSRDRAPSSWWERFRERQRRPHAPGVWVVYFSLAALPLFGIGQWFIPAGDVASRRRAFFLLLVYVASGLGLLLSTSFLGLRRYLRQRHLEMPAPMAGAWIAIGCVLIVGLLLFCALLPRPGAEFDIAKLPFRVDSPTRQSSRHAMMKGEPADEDKGGPRSGTREDDSGSPSEPQSDEAGSREGTESEQGEAGSGSAPRKDGSRPGSEAEKGTPSSASEEGSGGPSSGSEAKDGTSDGASGSESEAKDAGSHSESGQQAEGSPSKSDANKEGGRSGSETGEGGEPSESGKDEGGRQFESDEDPGRSRSEQAEQQRETGARSSGGGSRRSEDAKAERRSPEDSSDSPPPKSAPPRRQPSFDPQALLQGAGSWVGTLFKWIFYGVLLLAIGYWLWRSRAEVLRAIKRFLQAWREFWQRLLGRKPAAAEQPASSEQGTKGPRARRFADFADPFASGMADRCSPDELVRYSFEALEAWAREHGWPRGPEQTPHEFAQEIGARVSSLSQDVRRLADLYCRVAYAPDTLPQVSIAPLRQLWREL
ncbi:MAG: hypothetical protein A2V98_00980, partial [Planctomycetes bacterium RBG_16_64_12]